MKTKFVVALLLTFSASVAAPAFASGYGPAPSSKPTVGASASQRGQSTQTIAANFGNSEPAYGGDPSQSQSSGRAAVTRSDSLYTHR